MSSENKTRLEVQAILRTNILTGMSSFGVDSEDFTVMEANQTPLTTKGSAILFKYTEGERIGWQAPKYRIEHDEDGNVTGTFMDHQFIDKQTWLISVLKPRPLSVSAETQLSDDVAQLLIAWFNGPGCLKIREYGISSLYIKEKPIEIYKNDSSLYEKSSSFTIKLLVPKVISVPCGSATVEFDGVYPI